MPSRNNVTGGFPLGKPLFLPDNEGVEMNTSPVRMDDLPLNAFHCRIAALTFGAHLTDGYVLGGVGYAIIPLMSAMQLTPFMAGMIGGAALLGLFLGSLILGWVSDHIGRQKIFTFSFMLITIASFLQLFVSTPEQLIALRILIGIGLGGDYSVGHTLLAEFAPRRHRGVLLGAFSVVWTIGYVLASLVGHHFISASPDAWRWLLASAALPALLITLLRWGTPESPRWLIRQGRFAEAHAVVHRYFGPHVLPGDEIAAASTKHIKTLFSARYWRRTVFNSVFFVCLVIPWFVIYTWLPTIARTVGLEDALTASLLLNALLIVGALLGLLLTHLLTHRRFLLGSFLLLAATLFVMAFLPPGSAFTLLLFVLFSTTISAVSNLVGILPAESFPTDIRSLGVGFATAMSRLGAAISTGLLPLTLAQWGMQVTLLLLAGVLLIGFIVTWLWAPETKALPLAVAGRVEKRQGGVNEHSVSV
ncbi:MFS transporter [Citrobacter sedlakii]|uniref:MFS transporter n=1 Tax=Citrobacter sedlakii TaxID=67826 RepID=UPI001F1F708F|nr:MFS transporter [Citrobacter sedlakii]